MYESANKITKETKLCKVSSTRAFRIGSTRPPLLTTSVAYTFVRRIRSSANIKPLKSPKRKDNIIIGAHSIDPKPFASYRDYLNLYQKYIDFKKFTTTMFSITTINHKTFESQHPLLMVTNREGCRYFFGKVSEGTQRVLNENRFRLGKLKGIFLTGTLNSWSEIGGLPGLFLTISDSTKKDIDVYTNSGKILSYVVATWRYFVFRKGVEIKINDADPERFIGDSNLIIKPIKIASAQHSHSAPSDEEKGTTVYRQLKKLVSLMFPLDTSKVNDPDPSSYKSDPADNDIQTHVSIEDVDLNSESQTSLNYLIRFQPIRGKFNPIRAKELGIKPGIDFRNLTQGISVVNEKGEEVHPDQVMGQSKHFKKLVILDIPNNDYLSNTMQCNEFFATNEEELGNEEIGVVYHFLGDEVNFELDQYLKFIKKFPPDCVHIISHSKIATNTIIFKTFAIDLLKLKSLASNSFNLPYNEPYSSVVPDIGPLQENVHIQKLHQLQKYVISSEGVELDDSLIPRNDWSSLYDEHISPFESTINEIGPKSLTIDSTPISLALTDKYTQLKDNVQIATLGTGSALPSIYRNVISNLIRIPFKNPATGDIEFFSVLLDAGENTLGSLLRTFGHDKQYVTIMQELKLIYLSHLHADHHLGIITIINKWFEVNKDDKQKVLHLIVPWQYNHFMTEWYKLEGLNPSIDMSRINYISCEDFLKTRTPEYKRFGINQFEENFDSNDPKLELARDNLKPIRQDKISLLYKDLNIVDLNTCRAIHCYWSYSISIQFVIDQDSNETFKVSYSGDTRPNVKFVQIGYNSDLLIHESTLDNELIEEAISKKHTTMVEAINITRFMNCKKLILTHFSTRYSNKGSFITTELEFELLSQELKKYLQDNNANMNSNSNIFSLDTSKYSKPIIEKFDDLEILYAFDTLITRLSEICDQKNYIHLVNQLMEDLDASEDDDLTETVSADVKAQKELEKQRIKREAKRVKRLSIQKKRKVNSDEENT